jgi:hypothetical protein
MGYKLSTRPCELESALQKGAGGMILKILDKAIFQILIVDHFTSTVF